MISNELKDQHAFIILNWRDKLLKLKKKIAPLKAGSMEGLKPRDITVKAENIIKGFLKAWNEGRVEDYTENLSRKELGLIHVRLQFAIDILGSYLVQLASGSPLDYRQEIEIPQEPDNSLVFRESIKRLMISVWPHRAAEWVAASCGSPDVSIHCLAEYFCPNYWDNFVMPKIEDMIRLK